MANEMTSADGRMYRLLRRSNARTRRVTLIGKAATWQRFRTKKDRSLELRSVYHECAPGKRKLAVKMVDIFGNDTMTIVEVKV